MNGEILIDWVRRQKHEVQVVHCGLMGEVLVLAQPQELFAVLEEHFDRLLRPRRISTMIVFRQSLTS